MRFLIFGKSKLTRNLRFSDDIPFPSLQFLSKQTKDEREREKERDLKREKSVVVDRLWQRWGEEKRKR